MKRILLVDDHHVVRQGLRTLLEAEPDMDVIGEAGDGLEAIRLVESLQPDIMVLDMMMSGMTGLEVAQRVRKLSPVTGVVILSMYSNEAYVLEALRAGAKAYVLKEATSEELLKAIREVSSGRRYLSSSLSERAIEKYIEKSENTELDAYDTLTTREREVLHMVLQGFTSAEIASQLYLSPRTVEVHRANIMRKLGVQNQTQLVHYAMQRMILPL